MKNYIQPGDVLDLAPSADVASGTGFLFGASLFGVAVTDAKNGVASPFRITGVIEIAKTSALAISVGDKLFWDPAAKVVNKTATAQQCVGVAVAAAVNPSATVRMLLGDRNAVAT